MISELKRPTFQEWMRSQTCKKCSTPLDLSIKSYGEGKYKKLHDMDFEKVKGFYCSDCADIALAELMNSRFVENYKGHTIFHKDGKYQPYWECSYYFKTIEDCRARIDANTTAVMPQGVANLVKFLGGNY